MENDILVKYAQLLLKIGVNLQKDQNLYIESEPIHWDFINILVEEAYKAGAKYVKVNAPHLKTLKARVNHASGHTLTYVPQLLKNEWKTMIEEEWAHIYIDGHEDPDIFEDLNQERNAIIQREQRVARLPMLEAMVDGTCSWLIASMPTEKWAAKILNMEPTLEAKEKLWEIFKKILFLDQNDPIQKWMDQAEKNEKTTLNLNALNLKYVRFVGPETDLKITLIPQSNWVGTVFQGKKGYSFMPNIPTFEIFTVPDYRLTEGKVKVSRPVEVLGSMVEEAWFEFHEGKVIRFGARKGEDLLRKYFEIDEYASFLGEVALVDVRSPIYQANLIFYSILFDENAASHIALGRGLSNCIVDSGKLTQDALKELGVNPAMVHTDFMIGTDKMNVFGGKSAQEEILIMKNGEIVV